MAWIAPLLGAIGSGIATNQQNKANIVNSQNATNQSGQNIWNAGMEASQLINQLLGGGFKGPQQMYGGGQSLGGGIMGTGGQFMQPMQNSVPGFGGQNQISPQVLQMLQAIMGGNQGGGMMRPPILPGGPQMGQGSTNQWGGGVSPIGFPPGPRAPFPGQGPITTQPGPQQPFPGGGLNLQTIRGI